MRPISEPIAETLRSSLSDCLAPTNAPDLYASLGPPVVSDVSRS